MTVRSIKVISMLSLLLVLGWCLPALAGDELFNLKIHLQLDDEMTAMLQEGDRFEISLAPASKYGPEDNAKPIVLENTWSKSGALGEWNFTKAMVAGQIYEIELRILRGSAADPVAVRYLSALDRLPRKPADSTLKMRLTKGHANDTRNTLVLVNKDSDGVYRISVFTA